jgi:hypothetical protein
MSSNFTSTIRLFLILVFVCATSIGNAATQAGGRLIVLRSPTFGWNIVLNLKIDGRTVANVVQGRRYDHLVPPGRHVLTASAAPNSYYSEPTSTALNVRSGHTYVFTGAWDGSNRVVLIPSALPPGQSY